MEDPNDKKLALEAAKLWLSNFSASVRARDFQRGESLFDQNVKSFGTWTEEIFGLTALVDSQWRNVWPKTQ